MANLTITDALKDMCSGLPWTMRDADYDSIEWLDETTPKPTLEALEQRRDELIADRPWKELREERDKRLAETDYLATIDYPHASEEAKQAWLDYRQALRDLPANTTDPENPVWPAAPL